MPIGCLAICPLSTLRRCTIAIPLKPPIFVSRFGVGWETVITTVSWWGAVTVLTALICMRSKASRDDALIRVDHVVGAQGAAVVKRDASAQVERPRELVGADAP